MSQVSRSGSTTAEPDVEPQTARSRPLAALIHLVRTHPTLVAALVLVVGALLASAVHVRYYAELSPVDELQHIDYLYKAPHLVHNGEKVGQEAMREEACRTLPNYPAAPACSTTATYDPDDFQENGTNTAAIYTPLYYTLTKAVALPLQWVTGMDSLVTAARLVGGLWLAGGLVMTLLVARRLGAHPYPTAGMLLAAAVTPNVLLPAATITPDAAALLAGAALVWSVLWWEESPRRRLWLPALLALVAVSLKALNIIAVVLVALYLVLRYLQRRFWPRDDEGEGLPARDARGPGLGQSVVGVAVVSVVALAGAIGYMLFAQATTVASSDGVSMAERLRATSFPLVQLIEHVGVFLQVFYAPGWWVTVPVLGPLIQSVLGLVVFAGTFGAAFLVDRVARRARALASSLLVVGLVGAPLIIAFSYVAQGMFVPIPGRYALTLVPAGLALTAATLQRRPVRLVCGFGGLACYLVAIGWMLA
jgi:hypothetical protein